MTRLFRLGLLTLGLACLAQCPAARAPVAAQQQTPPSSTAVSDEAQRLNQEIERLHKEGKYADAIPLAMRLLALLEQTPGTDPVNIAGAVNNLASSYENAGDYHLAGPLYARALAIIEKAAGPDDLKTAITLNNLAVFYRNIADYGSAEPLLQRALAIKEKKLGKEDPSTATSINNLAALYDDKGDYERAEPLYQQSLAIREKTLGQEHASTSISLNNLATLYTKKGDHERAEPLFLRTLEIREKALGPDHPSTIRVVNNLGELYKAKGDYERAEGMFQRALAVREKTDKIGAAVTLNNLAGLYESKGDFEQAERLYQRALAIKEQSLGAEHPSTATTLNNLAYLYDRKGDYQRAEPLYQRVTASFERRLGAEHESTATAMSSLAALYEAKGDAESAEPLLRRVATIRERNLVPILLTGSERQKLLYLRKLSDEADSIISFHTRTAPANERAAQLALSVILQRKGRALDAMSEQIGVLRRRADPEGLRLLDRLLAVSTQLATLQTSEASDLTPQRRRERITQLENEAEQLQADISRRSAAFRQQFQPVTLEAAQAAMPAGVALIEFRVYRPFNARFTRAEEQFGPPRYVGYVLRRAGLGGWADLGEAKMIDEAVVTLRKALRDRQDVTAHARNLDRLVMQPFRKLLGETRQILLSPDGALNLVPFAALVDEQNRWLLERYSFSYLTSGRDLLRLQTPQPQRNPPVLIANPYFGRAQAAASALPGRSFPALAETMPEALALLKLLPRTTTMLVGEEARESTLKQQQGPRLLHIATHGFFLPDAEAQQPKNRAAETAGAAPKWENPLLRSGLALAGANSRPDAAEAVDRGYDDGILTALEVAGLDLWGTQLVALPACDAGFGAVRNGEGVYGLRRALALAGAETQIVTLWRAPNVESRKLMASYYQKLLREGVGRGEALRQAQLNLLKGPKRTRHPYYWAGFIQIGEWANLEGKR
jgi:CHAT domain-containing protein/Tfp pilus assembly protein PilF